MIDAIEEEQISGAIEEGVEYDSTDCDLIRNTFDDFAIFLRVMEHGTRRMGRGGESIGAKRFIIPFNICFRVR